MPSCTPKVVQLHPTLRCNLTCAHCYSTSGPRRREELSAELIKGALDNAAGMGYGAVTVSGGEPFLYGSLPDVLRHAKSLRLRTAVTTNGTSFGRGRLEAAAPWIDVLAISCDGPADLHNRMRDSPTAFARMVQGIELVREAGLRFGIIHTVTRSSWDRLVWLGRFAVDQGAGLLQLHPLEMTGRAVSGLPGQQPDGAVLARSWIMAQALATEHRHALKVQIDLITRRALLDHPERVLAGEVIDEAFAIGRAADHLGVLVVEPDGTVVPISFGLSRAYEIGNLGNEPLRAAWANFARRRYAKLRALCRSVRDSCLASRAELFSWHDILVRCSHNARAAESTQHRYCPTEDHHSTDVSVSIGDSRSEQKVDINR